MNNDTFFVTDSTPFGDGTSQITVNNGKNSRKFIISTRLVTSHGITVGSDISNDGMDTLQELAEITRAIKKGLDLLSYSDTSKRTLARKLVMKGYTAEISECAVSHLEAMGYINEKEHALRLARSAAKQFYGPLAISDKLRSKGFEQKYIQHALKVLYREVDFTESLRIYAEAKGVSEVLFSENDPKARQKVCASLLRRGFTFEHIQSLRSYK